MLNPKWRYKNYYILLPLFIKTILYCYQEYICWRYWSINLLKYLKSFNFTCYNSQHKKKFGTFKGVLYNTLNFAIDIRNVSIICRSLFFFISDTLQYITIKSYWRIRNHGEISLWKLLFDLFRSDIMDIWKCLLHISLKRLG